MKQLGLFSGVGGFELAAKIMGWDTVAVCENNPISQRVLKYWFPNSTLYADITNTDFTKYRGTIDVLTGGFPSQPFSVSGKRRGTADARNLWPHMHRAIEEIRPRWVVAENVRGLLNWDSGMVAEHIQTCLENSGYSQIPFLLPASAAGAGHERYRIFFIAYDNSIKQGGAAQDCGKIQAGGHPALQATGQSRDWPTIQHYRLHDLYGDAEDRRFTEGIPTAPKVWCPNDGFPGELAGITLSKWVDFCQHSYGNAVHIGLIHIIYQAITNFENDVKNGYICP